MAGDYRALSNQMREIVENRSLLNEFKNQSLMIIKNWSIEQLVDNFEKALVK